MDEAVGLASLNDGIGQSFCLSGYEHHGSLHLFRCSSSSHCSSKKSPPVYQLANPAELPKRQTRCSTVDADHAAAARFA
jgi:hypothetical protein